jgi:hypothetical protein
MFGVKGALFNTESMMALAIGVGFTLIIRVTDVPTTIISWPEKGLPIDLFLY